MDKEKREVIVCKDCFYKEKGGLCRLHKVFVPRKKEACFAFKRK